MSTQELIDTAQAEHDALVRAGWTQRDFALALMHTLGEKPRVTAELGNLRIGGTVIEVLKLQGKRPSYTIVTSVGMVTVSAESILP